MKTLFCYLTVFMLAVPFTARATPEQCVQIMDGKKQQLVDHWRGQFVEAYKDDRPEAQLYSLLKMRLSAGNLPSPQRKAARDLTKALELQWANMNLTDSPSKVTNMTHFLGFSRFWSSDVFGTEQPLNGNRKSDVFKTLAADVLLGVGPTLATLARLPSMDSYSQQDAASAVDAMIENALSDDKLLAELERSTKKSATDVREELMLSMKQIAHQTPRDSLKAWATGRVVIPSAIMLGLLAGGDFSKPALNTLSDMLNVEQLTYDDSHFFDSVIDTMGGRPQGKLLVVMSNFLYPSLKDVSQIGRAFSNFTRDTTETKLVRFWRSSDVSQFDLSSYDNVVVIAPVDPRKTYGWDSTARLPKIKEGASLILFPVGLGFETIPEDLIEMRNQLIANGEMIAPTAGVLLKPDFTSDTQMRIVRAVFITLGHSLGIDTAIAVKGAIRPRTQPKEISIYEPGTRAVSTSSAPRKL